MQKRINEFCFVQAIEIVGKINVLLQYKMLKQKPNGPWRVY